MSGPETWGSSFGYEPDFVERNGAWLLSVLGVVTACMSGILAYFLKSRCSRIKCCGIECERDVLNLERVPEDQLQVELSRRVSTPRRIRFIKRTEAPPATEPPSSNASV
jgi:hypothetical protein